MKKMLAVSVILLLIPFLRFGSAGVQAVSAPAMSMDHSVMAMDHPAPSAPVATPNTTVIQFGGLLGLVYSPKDVLISPGNIVRWEGDFTMHPLVSDEALWTTVNSGTQFEFTFNTPGVYHFHCFFHGVLFGMAGTVTVGLLTYIPEVQK